MMFKRLIPAVFLWSAPLATAAEYKFANLTYSLDLGLTYIDKLKHFNAASTSSPQTDTFTVYDAESAPPRALGLTRLRAGLSWSLPEDSRLDLVLRPDAALATDGPDTEASVFDSRSGRVYRGASKLKLLDAYQVSKLLGETFEVSVGVWEEIAARQTSYEPALEFGLLVKMMERFSAMRLSWKNFGFTPDHAQELPPTGFVFDLYVTKGDGERAETRTSSLKSADTAPSSTHPHYGLALALTYLNSETNRTGFTLGSQDAREEGEDAGSPYVARRNEVYGQIFNVTYFKLSRFSTKVALDLRLAKEKWRSDQVDFDTRTQQSVSLTTSVEVSEGNWALLGAHFGRSELANEVSQSGYQLDVGYLTKLGQNIDFTFLATDEHRELEADGEVEGGFATTDGTPKILRRFALELRYLLGQSS